MRRLYELKEFSLDNLTYDLHPPSEPALVVQPGEIFVVETEDAFSGQIRTEKDWTHEPRGPTISGPIFVDGAEKGDTLMVDIKDIQPLRGQGATRINVPNLKSLVAGPLAKLAKTLPPPSRWVQICPVKDGKVYWGTKAVLPYKPMIGTIGLADGEGKGIRTGNHGGNMDIVEVGIGNKVYLPISVKGAYLYLGDVHATQGEGELCGTAIEMPALVTLVVDLIKNKRIGWPRIESPEYLMAVGTARPVEDAIEIAFTELILWLEEDYGVDRWDAYNLCTQVSEISIGWYLTCSAGAKFPKKYLPKQ